MLINQLPKTRTLKTFQFYDVMSTLEKASFKSSYDLNLLNPRSFDNRLKELQTSIVNFFSPSIDLSSFQYFIPTLGATEAINQWYMTETRKVQVFNGEYPWIEIVNPKVTKLENINTIKKNKVLFLSFPFSGDGNYRFLDDLKDIPIVLDITLMPTAKIKKTTLSKNVEQVFVSFGKYLGLPGMRLGARFYKEADCFTRLTEHHYYPHLIFITQELIAKRKTGHFYKKFEAYQSMICSHYQISQSDTVFIANTYCPKYKFWQRESGNNRLNISSLIADTYKKNNKKNEVSLFS